MVTNTEVVESFIQHKYAQNRNLKSTGVKLYSYDTCIAEWYVKDGLIINKTKYSKATLKHQYLLNYLLKNIDDILILEVNNIPKDEISLYSYANLYKLV